MDEAHRILEWMRQNDYELKWLAECIDFSSDAFSQALTTNHISHRLADALYEHFGIRIIPDGVLSVQSDLKEGALQVWRRGVHRRRLQLKSRAIDLEHHREHIRRSSGKPDQNENESLD